MASSESIVYLFPRVNDGLFSSTEVRSGGAALLKNALPGARHPVWIGGQPMDPAWYRFFQLFTDVFIGSAGSYTLPEVIRAVEDSLQRSATQEAKVNTIADQSGTNAEVLAAMRQVVQDNALTGSEQIPPPRLSGYDIV